MGKYGTLLDRQQISRLNQCQVNHAT